MPTSMGSCSVDKDIPLATGPNMFVLVCPLGSHSWQCRSSYWGSVTYRLNGSIHGINYCYRAGLVNTHSLRERYMTTVYNGPMHLI